MLAAAAADTLEARDAEVDMTPVESACMLFCVCATESCVVAIRLLLAVMLDDSEASAFSARVFVV